MQKILSLSLALVMMLAGSVTACTPVAHNSAANGSNASPAATAETEVGGLEKYRWELVSIRGEAVELAKEGDTPFLSFDKEKGSAGGNTGCNVFGGSYEEEAEGKIRIFDTVSTMRACIEDNRMEVEREFMDALQSANRYEIDGTALKIFDGETLLLEFSGKEKPE
jgi:heat shock protein HslJ